MNIPDPIPERLAESLDERGFVVLPALLRPDTCEHLRVGWKDPQPFRSTVVMARHGFGQGEYRYYRYPLPPVVEGLRQMLYPQLAPLARDWAKATGNGPCFPDSLEAWLDVCHRAGQIRPTPLLLRYGPEDYNCLHQDLYGDLHFPLQVAVLLSRPGEEFTGGAFVLTEQRPRRQSRVEVVPLRQGDAVVFAVNHRPVAGARGLYRVTMRHGVSRVRSGERFALGIIFHDAA